MDTYNHRIRVIVVLDNAVSTLTGRVIGFNNRPLSVVQFHQPIHGTCNTDGIIYITKNGNNRIRKITLADGQCVVTTLSGNGTKSNHDNKKAQARCVQLQGIAVDGSDNVLITKARSNPIHMITPVGTISTLGSNITTHHVDRQGTTACCVLQWPQLD